tara:strand:+ start:235 stop:450 length:216 start_codon:yes stop_codon:yes gene_type:complete
MAETKKNTFTGFSIDNEGYFVARLALMKGVRSKSNKSETLCTTSGKVGFVMPDGRTAQVNLNVYVVDNPSA